MMADGTVRGRCLCGEVAWEIDGPVDDVVHCHCTTCRKAHGVAFATFVTFAREAFRWVRGEAEIRRWRSSRDSERAFCGRCGSKVPALEPFAYAFAGPLEGALGAVPSAHIFVGSKAPWHAIGDALPRYEAFRDGGVAAPTPRHTEVAAGRIRGGCLCGAVAYEIRGPLVEGAIVSCHCTRCRRGKAALHGSNLFVDERLFAWLRGQDRLCSYRVPETRHAQTFCEACGSIMPAAVGAAAGFRMVPCGSLDDDPGVREGPHIQVASKAAWEEIPAAVEQADTYPTTGGFPPIARGPGAG